MWECESSIKKNIIESICLLQKIKILFASDWLIVITWPGYWSLIGGELSRDLDSGLWFADTPKWEKDQKATSCVKNDRLMAGIVFLSAFESEFDIRRSNLFIIYSDWDETESWTQTRNLFSIVFFAQTTELFFLFPFFAHRIYKYWEKKIFRSVVFLQFTRL